MTVHWYAPGLQGGGTGVFWGGGGGGGMTPQSSGMLRVSDHSMLRGSPFVHVATTVTSTDVVWDQSPLMPGLPEMLAPSDA